MPFMILAFACALLAIFAEGQTQSFVTLPGAKPVTVDVIVNQSNSTSPGYIFVTPYLEGYGYGPHIFDQNGELVWWGNYTVTLLAMDLQVCAFNGSLDDHLCYNERHPPTGSTYSSSIIRVFDNTYTEVEPPYGAAGHLIAPDFHELNMPLFENGHSFIQDVYQTVEMDLSDWGGTNPGYVVDGCFQEINTTTREVLFQWCSLDWVPLQETYIYLPNSGLYSNGNSGLGTQSNPWDYFHINAIDKNLEGDYLVSSRYTDTIYKVAGAKSPIPGSILWYLNGVNNEFEMEDGLNFSRQHHARFILTGATESTISLFDNASDGSAQTANATSGMVITVNNATMTASLAQQYVNPDGLIAVSQGSVQILDNSNVFIGWGQKPYYSEFSGDGSQALLYHALYAPGLDHMMSFRTWKYDWVGKPATPPTLVAYAQTCNTSIYAYVSWNGATEVDYWVFSTGASADGPWQYVSETPKLGFETRMWLTPATPMGGSWVLAEAYDVCGRFLGRSLAMKVFMPGEGLAVSCGATRCVEGTDYWEYGKAVVC